MGKAFKPRGAYSMMRIGACTTAVKRILYHGDVPRPFGRANDNFWKLKCVNNFIQQGTYTYQEIQKFAEQYATEKGKPPPGADIEEVALGFANYLLERARTLERWRYGSAENGPGYVGPGSGPRTLKLAIRGTEWQIEQLRKKEQKQKDRSSAAK